MLPSRIMSAVPDLIALPVPVPVSGFDLNLAWHRRRAKDTAIQHVASLLTEVLE